MTTVLNELGRTLNRAWESLAAGWRELVRGAGSALTHYTPADGGAAQAGHWAVPSWGLQPGEIIETNKAVAVQLELPGVERDDLEVEIVGGSLRVAGEKRADREYLAENYYLRQRAYGRFERTVPLPPNCDTSRAKACYRGGVPTVEFSKTASDGVRRITVQ